MKEKMRDYMSIKFTKKHKIIVFSTIISFILIYTVLPVEVRAIPKFIEEGVSAAFSFLIRIVADGISNILSAMDMGMDKLVFNVKSNFNDPILIRDANISLLKNNNLSENLIKLYNVFVYIAASLMGAVATWVTVDFIRAGNDPGHKKVLKSRLVKLTISIVFLTSLPVLFDEILIINQVIIDLFRLVIIDFTGGLTIKNGAFLTDIFKAMAVKDKTDIIMAGLYLISSVINIWMVIIYMVRDLTISLLYIMGPIMSIYLPYREDLMKNWVKQILANIFTQAIHAFVLAVVISIAGSLTDTSPMYDKIFAIVGFASFIPMTGIAKKMLGIDGDVGAASAAAGIAPMLAAIGLAGGVYSGIKNRGANIGESYRDLRNLGSEEKLLRKGEYSSNLGGNSAMANSPNNVAALSSSRAGLFGGGRGAGIDPNNRSATNRNHGVETRIANSEGSYTATSRARQLQGERANARKNIRKNVVGGIGSATFGSIAALGSSALGSPFATMMAARVGGEFGSDIGEVAGTGISESVEYSKDKIDDYIYGEGIRYDGEQNVALGSIFEGADQGTIGDRFNRVKENYRRNRDVIRTVKNNDAIRDIMDQRATGLSKEEMNPRDYEVERKAILKRNSLERRGKYQESNTAYANKTYDRNTTYLNDEAGTVQKRIGDSERKKIRGNDYRKVSEGPDPSSYGSSVPIKPIDPNSGGPNTEVNKEIKRSHEDDYLEAMNKTYSDLAMAINEYNNNNEYMDALNSFNYDDSLYIGSDYSQFS